MGQMGGWGVRGGKGGGGVEAPIWYPISLSGISSYYLVCHFPYLVSHLLYLVFHPINESPKWNSSLLDIFVSYLHCFCIANAKYKGIVSSNNLQILLLRKNLLIKNFGDGSLCESLPKNC